MTMTKDPRLSAVCGYVNFDRYDELERLADGLLQEITGTLSDGTGWTVSHNQITIGNKGFLENWRKKQRASGLPGRQAGIIVTLPWKRGLWNLDCVTGSVTIN